MDILSQAQYFIISKISNKFKALQRLAELLEQAGDAAQLIPFDQLQNLPPLSLLADEEIAAQFYAQLRASCPNIFPPYDQSQSNKVREEIRAAYQKFLDYTNIHQYNRMDQLQNRIDDMIGKMLLVNYDINTSLASSNWQSCATGLCSLVSDPAYQSEVTNQLARFTNRDLSSYANFQATAGATAKVLTEAQQTKVRQLKNARQHLTDAMVL